MNTKMTALGHALFATALGCVLIACGTVTTPNTGGVPSTGANDAVGVDDHFGPNDTTALADAGGESDSETQTDDSQGADIAAADANQVGDVGGLVDVGPPAYEHDCDPCQASSACKQQGHEAACVDGGQSGSFCGQICGADIDCPVGYACKDGMNTEAIKGKYCVAVTSAGDPTECRCSPAASQAQLSTPCWKDQVDGKGAAVGKCPGKRTCTGPILGACQMTSPDKEVCDGIDNDCDGFVDPSNALLCPNAGKCVDGKCVSDCKPVDGGWTAWQAGPCDKKCGGGTSASTRTCTNPAPSCGGKVCVGLATQKLSCNTQPCVPKTGELPSGKTVYSTPEQVIKGAVPAGKSAIDLHLWGAGGGGGAPGVGGGGAHVQIKLAVAPGDQVELRVAGGGVAGGGGGGASYVLLNGKVVAVAAGGGGGGSDGCSGCSGKGLGDGGGGGMIGGNGGNGATNNKYNTGSGGGQGGTQTAGGAAGKTNNQSQYNTCNLPGKPGAQHTGGAGATGKCTHKTDVASWHVGGKKAGGNGTGGDGGAGWYGGGSGATMWTYSGGGGGGGSSFIAKGVTLVFADGGKPLAAGGQQSVEFTPTTGKGGLAQEKAFGTKPEPGGAGRIVMVL